MMEIGTFGWILATMTFSTGLVMVNKYVMKTYDFNWPVTLTAYHFLMTFTLLEVMCRMGFFERASSIPKSQCWKNAFFNVCGIVFMNFNLKMNSVGFYQLSKLCCIPLMVVVKFVVFHQKTPFRTCCCLLVLIVGIALFSVNEVSFNIKGTIMACIAVCCTTTSQFNTNTVSQQYKCFGPPFQHITAFPMTVLAWIASLCTEMFGDHSIFKHEFHGMELPLCIVTGFMAIISNVSAFALIGKQSPITYQVVGHAKTIIIFTYGLIFDSNPNETREQLIKKIFGLVLGMSGTIMYTVFEMIDKEKAKKQQEENERLKESTSENDMPVGDFQPAKESDEASEEFEPENADAK